MLKKVSMALLVPAGSFPHLILSNLAAGTYTIVVSLQPGATGVLQRSLASTANAPRPGWAYVAFAFALLVITQRKRRPQLQLFTQEKFS